MSTQSVLVRFSTPQALVAGVETLRGAGFRPLEAYSPFPVPGLSRALGFKGNIIAPLALIAGLIASAAAFGLQWYSATLDYPFVVGGKPLNSWPAFMLVTFEVGMLAAVLTAFIGMLVGNRLPKPYHPVFNGEEFERASGDGYFLLLRDDGEALDTQLRALNPERVTRVQT